MGVESERIAAEKELSYEFRRSMDHANQLAKTTPEKSKDLVDKLLKLEKMKPEIAYRIANIMPKSRDEVRAIFAKERFTLSPEEIDSIIDLVMAHFEVRIMKAEKKEVNAMVLDVLMKGHAEDPRPQFKREPVVQAMGLEQFKLLELIPKPGVVINLHDKVYIGDSSRDKIERVKRRISYDELTQTAGGTAVHDRTGRDRPGTGFCHLL